VNCTNSRLARLPNTPGVTTVSLHGKGGLTMGCDTVHPQDPYVWDGRRRGGHPRHPVWLFQYTLSGRGLFEHRGTVQAVEEGMAFCAKIPSAHRYRNDPTCPVWRFCWIIVHHPYAVNRLVRHAGLVNVVLRLPAQHPIPDLAATLFARVRGAADDFDTEAALFRWMLELERHAVQQDHPHGERRQLLEFVRGQVMNNLEKFLGVSELSRLWGTSRSNFSHHFRRVTGRSPAAFVRDIRLQEAARLLEESEYSIKEIAAHTGFAGANHLCKCFRWHWQTSPGDYRRLVGWKRRTATDFPRGKQRRIPGD
jgi:AraC-like DNA-binding protein